MVTSETVAGQLCLKCGLCCNGVLFRDVELQPGDDARRLSSVGLPIKVRLRKGSPGKNPSVAKIAQPCAALCAGNRCRVYAERPSRCRDFECALFKAVQEDEVGLPAALRTVRLARQRAAKVQQLLRALGERNEELALSLRFKRIRRHLESNPPSDSEAELFADLTLAVHDLNFMLSRQFYPGSNGAGS